eukprot:2933996-Rhodomonas_salina.3
MREVEGGEEERAVPELSYSAARVVRTERERGRERVRERKRVGGCEKSREERRRGPCQSSSTVRRRHPGRRPRNTPGHALRLKIPHCHGS